MESHHRRKSTSVLPGGTTTSSTSEGPHHYPVLASASFSSAGPATVIAASDGLHRDHDDPSGGSDHDSVKVHPQHHRGGRRASSFRMTRWSCFDCGASVRLAVLLILCLQNSLFTVLRRYSQGILLETYSKYECLLLGELIKIAFSAWMIRNQLVSTAAANSGASTSVPAASSDVGTTKVDETFRHRMLFLVHTSGKMVVLALIYGAMNILSFVALRNIGAGLFTIFAQAKIFTTALFSAWILKRQYTWTQWRALGALLLGVLLFSEPVWNKASTNALTSTNPDAKPWLGTTAVLMEVTLSGFASIYFEKVIKLDPQQLSIWERNFQLALGSVPVYLLFIGSDGGGMAGFFGGWSWLALLVSLLGAAGGLLVALSIKYGDSILKTLATTGAIVLSSVLDRVFLNGPLTPSMMIAGSQVILAICNYTFDSTPPSASPITPAAVTKEADKTIASDSPHDSDEGIVADDEHVALVRVSSDASEGTSRKGV